MRTTRRYLMCRPEHFDVTYTINPWMDPAVPVDVPKAVQQWEALVATYEALGHEVHLLDPVPGFPDLVFTANAGLVLDGVVYGAWFQHEERRGEEALHAAWFRANGYRWIPPGERNEGEGDLLLAGEVILAGTGLRTTPAAHDEVRATFGREVVSLELVDPRYYHLDTALAVLDDQTIAWFPPAFAPAAQEVLAARFPNAIVASAEDAAVLGLNATSDGTDVVLSAEATGLIDQLRARSYVPHGVDLSEIRKAGGSAKCCTLQLR
jgi:N-dimethylarginine dimethylaminohydrolase